VAFLLEFDTAAYDARRMNIFISFTTSPEEFFEVARLYRKLAYRNYRSELLKSWIPLLAALILLLTLDPSEPLRPFFAGLIVMYFTMTLWNYWNYPKRVMQLWQPNGNLWSEHTVRLSEEGIDLNTEKVRVFYKWSAFGGWRETSNFFVLLTPDLGVMGFPKKSFDIAQGKELRGFLDSLRYGNLA
jgi:hypothetical protein